MDSESRGLILIVDDEEMVRLALEMVLNSEGYATICASDGLEAIDILSRREVDLVITDVKMPRANGIDVLKAAKAKNPAPKVIMITGFTSEDPSVALSLGADDFIYKVFKREEILKAVGKYLPAEGVEGGR